MTPKLMYRVDMSQHPTVEGDAYFPVWPVEIRQHDDAWFACYLASADKEFFSLAELCADHHLPASALIEASEYGAVGFAGKTYELTARAHPTNRIFSEKYLNFNEVEDGESYHLEYSAPAIDRQGSEHIVYWIFEAKKGEEGRQNAASHPWDQVDRVEEVD